MKTITTPYINYNKKFIRKHNFILLAIVYTVKETRGTFLSQTNRCGSYFKGNVVMKITIPLWKIPTQIGLMAFEKIIGQKKTTLLPTKSQKR